MKEVNLLVYASVTSYRDTTHYGLYTLLSADKGNTRIHLQKFACDGITDGTNIWADVMSESIKDLALAIRSGAKEFNAVKNYFNFCFDMPDVLSVSFSTDDENFSVEGERERYLTPEEREEFTRELMANHSVSESK